MYRPCWHCEGKKYNPLECPDICQWGWDRRRLKEFEDLNLEPSEILALKAENERLRASIPSCGCQYCLDGIDIIQMKFPNTHECGGTWWKESVRTPKYCPMCGRKLPETKEEGKDDDK